MRHGLADEVQQPVQDGVPGARVGVGRDGHAVVVDEQAAPGQLGERARADQVVDLGAVGRAGPRGVPRQQAEPGRR